MSVSNEFYRGHFDCNKNNFNVRNTSHTRNRWFVLRRGLRLRQYRVKEYVHVHRHITPYMHIYFLCRFGLKKSFIRTVQPIITKFI